MVNVKDLNDMGFISFTDGSYRLLVNEVTQVRYYEDRDFFFIDKWVDETSGHMAYMNSNITIEKLKEILNAFDIEYKGDDEYKPEYKPELPTSSIKLFFDRGDGAFKFNNGFTRVYLNGKWNYINTNGQIALPDQWVDYAWDFIEGFAKVEINNKFNFINTDGQLVWKKPVEEWFAWAETFNGGFAEVRLNDMCNFINTDGKVISDQWFDWVWEFSEGFALVRLNNKYNYINTKGTLLSKEWYKNIMYLKKYIPNNENK